MVSQLALRKKLEERRRNLPQRELALSENILLQRRIQQAARQAIIKAQRMHIDTQRSSMYTQSPEILELRRNQVMESLGITSRFVCICNA